MKQYIKVFKHVSGSYNFENTEEFEYKINKFIKENNVIDIHCEKVNDTIFHYVKYEKQEETIAQFKERTISYLHEIFKMFPWITIGKNEKYGLIDFLTDVINENYETIEKELYKKSVNDTKPILNTIKLNTIKPISDEEVQKVWK